jgi:hypothetical protein
MDGTTTKKKYSVLWKWRFISQDFRNQDDELSWKIED